ncbi:type VI secretion system baseplate subunit TssE [Yersinia mollaretii]|uniref:Protein ImpF n=1 Tax=Yersinia mollaretii TaxID=33060 RepID=A0A0U1IAB3_YERMO|nr:type VI secretion system baseplate subunit TssE [Yersinia mollaretii]MDA5527669.1 type VI secretion system baseplate subunit TssE [Yersinia mollaretii]MDA5533427.1 type VI secretion system baseplate subunit TssE [Yersinia mollaretii]MDN0109265.1 type VI secretion system baseplate subunit TssE [Yersinia mollaretii]MDR7875575.1 type VI secretion system baseplate subunit TssE [Yersinia mollaretii]NIL01360.1 type VI secretion system baseplate subunit TssE [Yersinia mollaretii]
MEKKRQFLPALLERLLDDEPKKLLEPHDKFFYDSRMMRKLVQRNIGEILNNANIDDRLNEQRHKWVATSVLNFGIAPLVGRHSTPHNWNTIERVIREAIIRFEPRVMTESLVVSQQHNARNGIVQFEIRGLIHWDPHPIDLCVEGAYDVETDQAELRGR